MKYMGSKRRIRNFILPIILQNRKNDEQYYVEPFCGGCNTIELVNGNRIANDSNEFVIAMWKSLVYENWIPPEKVSEFQYKCIKKFKEKYPKNLVGFCGVNLSFGCKWFDSYARNKDGTNYAMQGRENLLQQAVNLKGVEFFSLSYDKLEIPNNSIIYCDPPYKNTAGYKDKFDTDKFWEWGRKMSLNNEVFVSEYEAPQDFECVWSLNINTNLNANILKNTTEKLFKLK